MRISPGEARLQCRRTNLADMINERPPHRPDSAVTVKEPVPRALTTRTIRRETGRQAELFGIRGGQGTHGEIVGRCRVWVNPNAAFGAGR